MLTGSYESQLGKECICSGLDFILNHIDREEAANLAE